MGGCGGGVAVTRLNILLCVFTVLLQNGGFCNGGCITKRILLLQAFHSLKKTNIMQIMTKNITFFINLIFYHKEIVKLDHFMTLSLS